MLKIRRPLGRLIFNMGIAIPGKTVFLIETAPRFLYDLRDWTGISSRASRAAFRKRQMLLSKVFLALFLLSGLLRPCAGNYPLEIMLMCNTTSSQWCVLLRKDWVSAVVVRCLRRGAFWQLAPWPCGALDNNVCFTETRQFMPGTFQFIHLGYFSKRPCDVVR